MMVFDFFRDLQRRQRLHLKNTLKTSINAHMMPGLNQIACRWDWLGCLVGLVAAMAGHSPASDHA